jgi:hypothetical protein
VTPANAKKWRPTWRTCCGGSHAWDPGSVAVNGRPIRSLSICGTPKSMRGRNLAAHRWRRLGQPNARRPCRPHQESLAPPPPESPPPPSKPESDDPESDDEDEKSDDDVEDASENVPPVAGGNVLLVGPRVRMPVLPRRARLTNGMRIPTRAMPAMRMKTPQGRYVSPLDELGTAAAGRLPVSCTVFPVPLFSSPRAVARIASAPCSTAPL